MKLKLIVLTVLFLGIVSVIGFSAEVSTENTFAKEIKLALELNTKKKPHYQRDTFFKYSVPKYGSFTEEDVITLVKDYVPEKYQKAFFTYTESYDKEFQKFLRLSVLSIGQVESEWTPGAINKKNKNKTTDEGMMQLNSYNSKNDWFMHYYMINEEQPRELRNYIPKDKEEKFLIVCINHYRGLYKSCKSSVAVKAYNCGLKRTLKGNIPEQTNIYFKEVQKNYYDFLNKVILISKERQRKERDMLFEKAKYHFLMCAEQINRLRDEYIRKTKVVIVKRLSPLYFANLIYDRPKEMKIVNKIVCMV